MPKILLDTVTINSRGQLVLPINIRRNLKILSGGKLTFQYNPKTQKTTLEPIKVDDFVTKWSGIIKADPALSTKEFLIKTRKLETQKDQKLSKTK
jgi:bifunctional DNA-binding transcriptional regulator/antitoxin component of YhaV-PrlF toxin-antitoxin module